MPYPAELVGHRTDPVVHAVDTRWTMAYAAGIGRPDPCYVDTTVGVVAHPVFPVCLEWPAVLALRAVDTDGALGREELLHGVHATHDLTLHRAIRPAETLTTTATVVAAEERRPGTYELVRLDTTDGDGAPVVTTHMGSLFLGVPLDGDPVPARRARPVGPPTEADDRPEIGIDIAPEAAHVYTECARIFNPIHTDVAVAHSAGLPGPILHGTATLAMAISAVVDRVAGGDPTAVRTVGCRFGAMVSMPDRIAVAVGTTTVAGVGRVAGFEVRNGAGEIAISEGRVVVAEGRLAQ